MHFLALVALSVAWVAAPVSRAQCPTEPRLENFTGSGSVVCPCFIPGEEAGAILDVPADHYPIEILKVGIGWGSQFGGGPDQLEQAIKIYEGALPDPGAPVFSLVGPQLTDGVINEFDLEPLPGEIIIDSGPFTVTLEFYNQSDGDIFAPSVVHDGNGCQPGKNVVFASPGIWADACLLGVSGDWVFYVFYRKVDCGAGPGSVPDGSAVPGTPLRIGKSSGGQVSLTWSASCSTSDNDYLVYQGLTADGYDSSFPKLCTTGGATSATFTPGSFDRYFLVVPTDGAKEGSYGRDSDGIERPAAGAACQSLQSISCP
jgi:hypothetical protein